MRARAVTATSAVAAQPAAAPTPSDAAAPTPSDAAAPTPSDADIALTAPVAVAPHVDPCDAALSELAGNGEILRATDRDLALPSLRERRALARAAKLHVVSFFGGKEQQQVAAAFDALIADPTSLRIIDAVRLPLDSDDALDRVVAVRFTLDNVPAPDVGPYQVVVVELAGRWIALLNAGSEDEGARVIGAVDSDGDGWREILYRFTRSKRIEIWRQSVRDPKSRRSRVCAPP